MQIVDRDKLLHGPKEPTPENLRYPEISRLELSPLVGAHTTFPMLQMPIAEFAKDGYSTRDFVLITDEATQNECKPQGREMVWFADITIEAHPTIVSNFMVPEASGDFCSRGGRFGAHSSNESMDADVLQEARLHHLLQRRRARGRRARSLRPQGGRLFHPGDHRGDRQALHPGRGPADSCKVAIQTNNAETDDRGYIYIVDRANTGMHMLELTGEPRAIAGLKPQ